MLQLEVNVLSPGYHNDVESQLTQSLVHVTLPNPR